MSVVRGLSTVPPADLLVCYTQKDEPFRRQLDKRLSDLMHEGCIADCYDWRIPASKDFEGQFHIRWDNVYVILLLMSQDFLDAGCSSDGVVQQALERHETRKARVLPIVLRRVDLSFTPFRTLQAIPANGVPAAEWSRVDEALDDMVRAIRRVIEVHWSSGQRPTTASPLSSSVSDVPYEFGGAEVPERIGRYRVERILSEGGFGRVYLAHDDQLRRAVAIKVPHAHRVSKPSDIEAYIAEARLVAQLDHPGLVPVYDFGHTDDGLCYVVSKLIGTGDLSKRMRESCLAHRKSVEIVATVAEALAYAHEHDVVHRDIKPANILIDSNDKPFVADFGLALREEDFGKRAMYAGTPSYMSPEQARGEGHRVDGRSDVFSLGVVLYELLTGRKPFRGENLFDKIANTEAKPPRQVNSKIDRELERICLKAMANRIFDRYSNAKDFAEDLRHYLVKAGSGGQSPFPTEDKEALEAVIRTLESSTTRVRSRTDVAASTEPARIVPKGLRSFDANDRDFFLELLPGPRDRDGLPESIRFWKSRIEGTAAEQAFFVGLIYGPSGCGKSSFVQAGLLPSLSDSVVAVYVDSAAGHTEVVLRKGLRRRCPGLPDDLSLCETVRHVRQGWGVPPEGKLLIVLDQFEHWLHATREEDRAELLNTIRQSDGERVQCLLTVRVDFWMQANRCMNQLEILIREGENSATVDLFDQLHARKVLAEFGRSFGRLPANLSDMTSSQKSFLDRAVTGLAENGKVIPVRLTLFADMIRGRPWTAATLQGIGGMEGVGVRFLEETFSVSTAPPEYRFHEQAARAVLAALLPSKGTDLRGGVRTHAQLVEAAGYMSRPRDFSELLRILDSELRLITPIDPDNLDAREERTPETEGEKCYQLTHDYLVPSVFEWLSRKQKETRRGRAELRLDELSTLWNARREHRQLPSLTEFLSIRWLTNRFEWSDEQKKMMSRADRYHAIRGCIALSILAVLVVACIGVARRIDAVHAANLVDRLLDADLSQVSQIIAEFDGYRDWTNGALRAELDKSLTDSSRDASRELRARLALLPVDGDQVGELVKVLLRGNHEQVRVIELALGRHSGEFVDNLWGVLSEPDGSGQSLRAACALALYDPNSAGWSESDNTDKVAAQLVSVPPSELGAWRELLKPAGPHLVESLSRIFRDTSRSETERSLAADVLVEYARDEPSELVGLIVDAEVKEHFDTFLTSVRPGECVSLLESKLGETIRAGETEDAKEKLARQQANAAVVLLRFDSGAKVWPLLKHGPDPRLRSYLIHRFHSRGVDPQLILDQLVREQDVSIRRALTLSLGEYDRDRIRALDGKSIEQKLWNWFRTDTDPGVHGAVGWLWGQWKMGGRRGQVEKELIETETQLKTRPPTDQRSWYVNSQGQTMVVIRGPVTFQMGSPPTEVGRRPGEEQRRTMKIGRSFAISAHEVTVAQYRQFCRDHVWQREYTSSDDCPVIDVTWYAAAEYCNWLNRMEGIPKEEWIYLPNQSGQFHNGMTLAPNYLSREGYRLPTEPEWEFACRAYAETSRYYGETTRLLSQYARYAGERWEAGSTLPVGSLKPNDFGLFDMHGNVAEWCQQRPRMVEVDTPYWNADVEESGSVSAYNKDDVFTARGGGFTFVPDRVRSADRGDWNPPNVYFEMVGFRVARTYPYATTDAAGTSPND